MYLKTRTFHIVIVFVLVLLDHRIGLDGFGLFNNSVPLMPRGAVGVASSITIFEQLS